MYPPACIKRALILLAALVTSVGLILAWTVKVSAPAQPAPVSVTLDSYSVASPGAALNWAEANALGHWYAWGGAGPSYDCSGLVMEAYGHADGIWLPHNTASMVRSGHLVRTWHPVRGDIAAWGPVGSPYHVGFVTIWHGFAFGALQSGTRIGWYSFAYWAPSAFYEVVR